VTARSDQPNSGTYVALPDRQGLRIAQRERPDPQHRHETALIELARVVPASLATFVRLPTEGPSGAERRRQRDGVRPTAARWPRRQEASRPWTPRARACLVGGTDGVSVGPESHHL
jgi:hypothetical protein